MPSEKEWVATLIPLLNNSLKPTSTSVANVYAEQGAKLIYAYEIQKYLDGQSNNLDSKPIKYETDILISDRLQGGSWIPRVVIECKLGSVTTHDAITYSNKASTHKHVHPYLRYGILLGDMDCVPGRLIRHGSYFDFMATQNFKPAGKAWSDFIGILAEEVRASRKLGSAMADTRSKNRDKYQIIHRKIKFIK